MQVRQILLVCTANMCRSPMAEALCRYLAAHRPALAGIEAMSAGVGDNYAGYEATDDAQEAMRDRGIDLSTHESQALSPALVEWADLILTMTPDHRDTVVRRHPDAAERTFTLGDYAGTGESVPDPVGRGPVAYEACAGQLERLLDLVLERLAPEPR